MVMYYQESFNIDEYYQKMMEEIQTQGTSEKRYTWVSFFFFIASMAALFFSSGIVAVILILISMFYKDIARDARSGIMMMENNWCLAQLINQNSNELRTIRTYLEKKKDEDRP